MHNRYCIKHLIQREKQGQQNDYTHEYLSLILWNNWFWTFNKRFKIIGGIDLNMGLYGALVLIADGQVVVDFS